MVAFLAALKSVNIFYLYVFCNDATRLRKWLMVSTGTLLVFGVTNLFMGSYLFSIGLVDAVLMSYYMKRKLDYYAAERRME